MLFVVFNHHLWRHYVAILLLTKKSVGALVDLTRYTRQQRSRHQAMMVGRFQ